MKLLLFALAASASLLAQNAVVGSPIRPVPYTVATLPAAASFSGWVAMVTDSVQPGSCTTGGGSGKTWCWSSGAAWVPMGIPYSGATVAGTWTFSIANATTMNPTGQFYMGATPNKAFFDNTQNVFAFHNTFRECWSSGTNPTTGFDVGFYRNAAGRLEINTCTAGTLADLILRSVVAGGTSPSVTPGTIGTGSRNLAGFITSATTGTFTPVLTFNGTTAPVGWTCGVSNNTTANLIRQIAYTTTTATFEGVTVSGDVITYNCTAF